MSQDSLQFDAHALEARAQDRIKRKCVVDGGRGEEACTHALTTHTHTHTRTRIHTHSLSLSTACVRYSAYHNHLLLKRAARSLSKHKQRSGKPNACMRALMFY